MRRRLALLAGLLAATMLASPVAAITNGQPDGGSHPYVGQLFFYVPDYDDTRFNDPGGYFNCSGTLVSPTVVVTAGHCAFGVGLDGEPTTASGGSGGNDVWVNFDEAPSYDGLPPSSGYIPDGNAQRYIDRVAWLSTQPAWHRGTAHPHPQYDDAAFFLYDLGVVVLDEPVTLPAGYSYATLPSLRYLDRYRSAPRDTQRFTPVGYGLEKVLPGRDFGGDTRRVAEVKLNTLNSNPRDTYAVFSNNNGNAHKGGTCFGDSGGPIFDGTSNRIVAVTSFGISPNCTGTGGGYRLDQPDDLTFLAEFGVTP